MSLYNHIILETRETYEPTANGKGWKSKPVTVERTVISADTYGNKTSPETVRFFNNFGYGSSCRAKKGYTSAGYIVTKINMIAPSKARKIKETYQFLYKPDMVNKGGFRENDILSRAVTFEIDTESDTVAFYTGADESGHRDGCEWSLIEYRWVG